MTQTNPNNSQNNSTNTSQPQINYQGYIEELQVAGEQLVSKIKELVREGNVRRIIIKQDGRTLLEIPLLLGAVGVVLAPVWAAIAVLGALIAECSIEVVREPSAPEPIKSSVEEITPTTNDPRYE